MPRWTKQAIAILVDAMLCVMCVHLAFYLRVNEWADPFGPMLLPTLASFSLALPIFSAFGMYKAVLRYYGARALVTIVKAVTTYGIIYSAIYTANSFVGVPRTVGIIQPILLGLFVIGVRTLISSLLVAETNTSKDGGPIANAVIYGAGNSGQQLASALKLSSTVNVVAFLDENSANWGTTINGVRVYAPDNLDRLIKRYGISEALLADTEAPRAQRNAIVQSLTAKGLSIRTIPGVDQLVRGTVSIEDLKDFEIEDLLRRAPVPPEVDLLRANVTGKVVLVTGAGG
ncbi:MAG: polysaccharide biosynthesis protein, partial [Pseudomonadota bacterium]